MDECKPHHDWFAACLTAGICYGLVVSYLPQHLRIINKRSSEGFSPWFLLLGSTSNASAMLNMVTMQWGVVQCCSVLSIGSCIESTAGIFQVALQWFLFTVILALYIMYYPPHLKYAQVEVGSHDSRPPVQVQPKVKSENWKLSIVLTWVVILHILLITFVTFFLLLTTVPDPSGSHETSQVLAWATFLGLTSATLAAIQYIPQIWHTYRSKLVGSLSIPMMIIQSPGAVVMVLSIALRPGTNWSSWITYAVAGIMQSALLTMCIIWHYRQKRLGIDDYGLPIEPSTPSFDELTSTPPTIVIQEAVEDAVETDVRGGGVKLVDELVCEPEPEAADEHTPLLGSNSENAEGKPTQQRQGWLRWITGRK